MVRETPSLDEALAKIKSIWDGPSEDALVRRVRVLYTLAKLAGNGRVVELGTYHGYGAFALAYGAWPRMIATVDDFVEKTGWAGEHYGPEDQSIFKANIHKLDLSMHIFRVTSDAVQAAQFFYDKAISLLYVDVGVVDALPKILEAWTPKMAYDGVVAFRDTLNRALGCDKLAASAVLNGGYILLESPDPYFILIRRIYE